MKKLYLAGYVFIAWGLVRLGQWCYDVYKIIAEINQGERIIETEFSREVVGALTPNYFTLVSIFVLMLGYSCAIIGLGFFIVIKGKKVAVTKAEQ